MKMNILSIPDTYHKRDVISSIFAIGHTGTSIWHEVHFMDIIEGNTVSSNWISYSRLKRYTNNQFTVMKSVLVKRVS